VMFSTPCGCWMSGKVERLESWGRRSMVGTQLLGFWSDGIQVGKAEGNRALEVDILMRIAPGSSGRALR
jgi:hypothetical protein